MKIQFIAIGDELLSGRTQDTNGKWLASFLTTRGAQLDKMVIISDNEQKIQTQLKQSWKEADVVIISGGLGPTEDDITKNSLAKFFNKKIVKSSAANQIAKDNYKNLNIPYLPENNGYNIIPQDFVPLKNPVGRAPGLLFKNNKKILISAPGVPREFIKMIEEIGWEQITNHLTSDPKMGEQVTIRTYGISEESIFFKLVPNLWQDLEKFGKVSSLPGSFAVDIIIHLSDKSKREQLISMINDSPLAPYIWQIGELSLAEYIIKKAKDKKLTIAFAESCTGGLVSSTLTDVAGSSSVFMGAAVSYSNDAKAELLNIPLDLITTHGAVSTEVAKAMAKGARKKFKADIAMSLTGIAGPGGGSEEKPVGTVVIGYSTNNKLESAIHLYNGDRLKLKERFSRTAQFKLLELIGI